MIRYQITGSNPVEMNTAAKLLLEHPRLDVDHDSGNRNGRKQGYIRYVHARIKKSQPKSPPPRRGRAREGVLDGAAKMSLANQCWQHILESDTDADAVQAIVKLIEYVERRYL